MEFYFLNPEVAGVFKGDTYEFSSWGGDPLLAGEAGETFLLTSALRASIEAMGLTGVTFTAANVVETTPAKDPLPKFTLMRVKGRIGIDDFGFTTETGLVVSERALDLLEMGGLGHADIISYDGEHVDKPAGPPN